MLCLSSGVLQRLRLRFQTLSSSSLSKRSVSSFLQTFFLSPHVLRHVALAVANAGSS